MRSAPAAVTVSRSAALASAGLLAAAALGALALSGGDVPSAPAATRMRPSGAPPGEPAGARPPAVVAAGWFGPAALAEGAPIARVAVEWSLPSPADGAAPSWPAVGAAIVPAREASRGCAPGLGACGGAPARAPLEGAGDPPEGALR